MHQFQRWIGVVSVLLLGPAVANAQVVVDPWLPEGSLPYFPIHGSYFSGEIAALGFTLRGADPEPVDVAVQLVERTEAGDVPLGTPEVVVRGLDLYRQPWLELTHALVMPHVNQPRRMTVQCLVRSRAERSWKPSGSLEVLVFPLDVLEPLRFIAGRRPLMLADPGGAVARLFQHYGIPFIPWEEREPWVRRGDDRAWGGRDAPLVIWVAQPGSRGERMGAEVGASGVLKLVPAVSYRPRTRIESQAYPVIVDAELEIPPDPLQDPWFQSQLMELVELLAAESLR